MISLYQDIILRLGSRFRKAHRQVTKLLLEKQQIAFNTIHSLFSHWDVEYVLVSRPKSDLVCRAIARAFHWSMPRGKFIGWDFKPLPEVYVAPARMGLMEFVERVKRQIAGKNRETKLRFRLNRSKIYAWLPTFLFAEVTMDYKDLCYRPGIN